VGSFTEAIAVAPGAAASATIQSRWRGSSCGAPNSLPYSKKKFFFSTAERSFYEILRQIAPNHTIFAKVRLRDLISVSNGSKTWQTDDSPIQSKHLDFLICDATLAPVVAIEFDDLAHGRANRQVRDQHVDGASAATAVPIVRIPLKPSYVLDDIRRLISPHLHGLGPLC